MHDMASAPTIYKPDPEQQNFFEPVKNLVTAPVRACAVLDISE